MLLVDLIRALVADRGRISTRDRGLLTNFLTHALALDSTSDRLLVVRAQTLRNRDI
ncbi:hypothetical protein [Streptomyces sp. NPDC093589]|uniref:hypothetical protein n=1 Tax=Streptomyces sp. NPDC093589 TaxID=3366043 RepID=UPI0038290A23